MNFSWMSSTASRRSPGSRSIFDFLGQSWGGMLTADHVSPRHHKGLRCLIIANAPVSETLWEERMLQYLSKFPQDFQDLFWKHERKRKKLSKGYRDASQALYNFNHISQVIS